MRRIVRVNRLLAELQCADVIDALEELKALRAALKEKEKEQTPLSTRLHSGEKT